MSQRTIRLGTRSSRLALAQAEIVAGLLRAAAPAYEIVVVPIATEDSAAGDKARFVRAIERALLDGRIDAAVHSLKDLPSTETEGLTVAATPARDDPRDALVHAAAAAIDDLPPGTRLGTSSLRRAAQALDRRPDLTVIPLRGNVDTRLRALASGAVDALILAVAGLRRAGLFDAARMRPIDPQVMAPAAGQGALAVQCRAGADCGELLRAIDDAKSHQEVALERGFVRALRADCGSSVGVLVEALPEHWVARTAVLCGDPPRVRRSSHRAGDAAALEAALLHEAAGLANGLRTGFV